MKKIKPSQDRWTITGVPPELVRESKALAAGKGISHGKFVSEALKNFNALCIGKKGE